MRYTIYQILLVMIIGISGCQNPLSTTPNSPDNEINGKRNPAKKDNNNFAVLEASGTAKFDAKDYAGSIPDLEKAIQLNPESITTYHYLGIANYRLKNYTTAIKIFDKIIEKSSDDDVAYTSRAEIKRDAGDLKGASLDIQKALTLNDTDGYLFATLAMIHADKGDVELFYQNLEKAVKAPQGYPLREKYIEKKTLKKFKEEERFIDLLEWSDR